MGSPKIDVKNCLKGKEGIYETVERIDKEIGGITRVLYNEGKRFKIQNHDRMYSVDMNYGKPNLVHALAVATYYKAQKNRSKDNYQNGYVGEFHILKGASTKHYKKGIEDILMKFAPQYAA